MPDQPFFDPQPGDAAKVEQMIQELIERTPGVTWESARRITLLTIGTRAVYPDTEAERIIMEVMQEAITAKEPWAVEYAGAELYHKIPAYRHSIEYAENIGADPVMALRISYELTAEQATEIVRAVADSPA